MKVKYNTNWIEKCIECGTTDKQKEYPMCYSCFVKWEEEKKNPKEVGCMFIEDD